MKPEINRTKFISITVAGENYELDVLIRSELFGTSHIISRAQAEHVYEDRASWISIETGQSGMMTLSDQVDEFFKKGCPFRKPSAAGMRGKKRESACSISL
jgi:hypothetical protein